MYVYIHTLYTVILYYNTIYYNTIYYNISYNITCNLTPYPIRVLDERVQGRGVLVSGER